MRCVPIKTAEQQAAHRLPEVARQVLQVLAAQLEQIEAAIGASSPPS